MVSDSQTRFGERLTARTWYGQVGEFVLRCAVKIIADSVKKHDDRV